MKIKAMHIPALFLFIIMVFGFLVIQSDLAEAEGVVCTVRQEILMRVPTGKQRKFPVPFHHIKHEIYNCTLCHHKFYESYTIGSCSVAGCHFDVKKRKGPESFYAAFHKIFDNSDRSCVDCHKTEGKGPTVCKECHTPRQKGKGQLPANNAIRQDKNKKGMKNGNP